MPVSPKNKKKLKFVQKSHQIDVKELFRKKINRERIRPLIKINGIVHGNNSHKIIPQSTQTNKKKKRSESHNASFTLKKI